jgi:hypothetical protein
LITYHIVIGGLALYDRLSQVHVVLGRRRRGRQQPALGQIGGVELRGLCHRAHHVRSHSVRVAGGVVDDVREPAGRGLLLDLLVVQLLDGIVEEGAGRVRVAVVLHEPVGGHLVQLMAVHLLLVVLTQEMVVVLQHAVHLILFGVVVVQLVLRRVVVAVRRGSAAHRLCVLANKVENVEVLSGPARLIQIMHMSRRGERAVNK